MPLDLLFGEDWENLVEGADELSSRSEDGRDDSRRRSFIDDIGDALGGVGDAVSGALSGLFGGDNKEGEAASAPAAAEAAAPAVTLAPAPTVSCRCLSPRVSDALAADTGTTTGTWSKMITSCST